MKMFQRNIIIIILVLISIKNIAQINFQKNIISTNALGANKVFAVDIDGDGDIDVLSASYIDDKIAWYENTDGLGTFGSQNVISINADNARSVYAADIDNDGDIDVVSASFSDNKIAWYENIDGLGTFDNEQIISTNAEGANCVYIADINTDGNLDILSVSYVDTKIAWYENMDGFGTFGTEQEISSANGLFEVFAVDIDGDGDKDVVYNFGSMSYLAWSENIDGLGTFGAMQIISYMGVQSICPVDIDNDGDIDIISASSMNDTLFFLNRNNNGLGDFDTPQIIDTNVTEAISVYPSDIDGDGDMDIISNEGWYENIDGHGTFNTKQIIHTDFEAISIYSSDFNNDGKIDILTASGNEIVWYENLGNVSVNKISNTINFSLNPNPAINNIQIVFNNIQYFKSNIFIYNIYGEIVFTYAINFPLSISTSLQNDRIYLFDISNLQNGVYFVKVGNAVSKFVKQ